MKILLCSESEIVRGVAVLALEAAGWQVVAADRADQLVAAAAESQALLVDPPLAKAAVALLRDRGFTGRALLFSDQAPGELSNDVAASAADGALALSPPDDLAARLSAAVKQRRVLIVDDSEIAARLLREELEPKGFEVLYAASAEAATSMITRRATRPDLILLDINMPKVDGAQFCRFVKRNERYRGIKVLLCSGQEKARVEQIARDCGADGYILKDQFLGKWIADQAG